MPGCQRCCCYGNFFLHQLPNRKSVRHVFSWLFYACCATLRLLVEINLGPHSRKKKLTIYVTTTKLRHVAMLLHKFVFSKRVATYFVFSNNNYTIVTNLCLHPVVILNYIVVSSSLSSSESYYTYI